MRGLKSRGIGGCRLSHQLIIVPFGGVVYYSRLILASVEYDSYAYYFYYSKYAYSDSY